MSLLTDILFAFKKSCPVCKTGQLFKSGLTIPKNCDHCGAQLSKNDVGDGASVVMIFILGFTTIPLAWMCEILFSPPMWFLVLGVGSISLVGIFTLLPVIKSYIMMLEYKHRPTGWAAQKKASPAKQKKQTKKTTPKKN